MFLRHQLMHLIFAATVISFPQAHPGPVVDLGYTQYQGTVSAANTSHFLGIRYAAAPLGPCLDRPLVSVASACLIGDLRFRGPQAPVTVLGVQQATTQPKRCFQTWWGTSPTNPLETRSAVTTSEDCLFLKFVLLAI